MSLSFINKSQSLPLKVLLARWFRLGDCLQAAQVSLKFRALGAETSFFGPDYLQSFFEYLDLQDHYLPSPSPSVLRGGRLKTEDQFSYILENLDLISVDYDQVVNFHTEPLISLFCKAFPNTGSYIDRSFPVGKANSMAVIVRRLTAMNLIDYWSRLAGIKGALALKLSSAEQSQGLHVLRDKEKPLILIQPASRDNFRTPATGFYKKMLTTIRRLSPEAKLIFIGKAEEQELMDLDLSDFKEAELRPDVPLIALSEMIKEADLLITPDTGPMHLASLLGTRTLALFMGGSDPVFTGPYLEGSLILYFPLECSPCNHPELCQRDYSCREYPSEDAMKSILTAAIFADDSVDLFPSSNSKDPLLLRQTYDLKSGRMLPLPVFGPEIKQQEYLNRVRVADYFYNSLIGSEDVLCTPNFQFKNKVDWKREIIGDAPYPDSSPGAEKQLDAFLRHNFSVSLEKLKTWKELNNL